LKNLKISNVHERNGSWYFVKQIKGKRQWIKLCRVGEGEHTLYRKLAKFTQPQAQSVEEMLDAFSISGMTNLSPRTQQNYRASLQKLKDGFGEFLPNDVEPTHIAQYLQFRANEDAPIQGNREITCLGSAFNYAMRMGWARQNPCHGVRRNRERPRDRYIRHDEFLAVFNKAPDHVQDLLAVAYLTGFRQGDLRGLRKSSISPDGIVIEESKTGHRRTITWSPALQFFLTRATSRTPHSDFVLTNSKGEPWSLWAVQSLMRRLNVDWTFHDIRAKAESDHEEGLGLLPLYKRSKVSRPVR